MKVIKKIILLVGALSTFTTAYAADLNKSQISKKFQEVTKFSVLDVEQSPISSLFQIISDKGVFYVTKDGQHIISGSVHELANGLNNLTAQRQAKANAEKIAALKDTLVTFKAPNQKHEIIVFYDTTCGYCQKLHSEISTYTAAGITVHYAAFPRHGITDQSTGEFTQNYKDMVSIWCAENPQMMLNIAARGGATQPKTCPNPGVEEQFHLGVVLGVEGTPAMFSMEGQMVSQGYAPASVIVHNLKTMGL